MKDASLKTPRKTENSKEFLLIMDQRLNSTSSLGDELLFEEKVEKLTNKVDLLESYEAVEIIELPTITVINEEEKVGPKLHKANKNEFI